MASSPEVESNNPVWYQLKNPFDHSEGNTPGMILSNVQLLSGQQSKIPRPNLKVYDIVKIRLYCFIYACYELEPETESEEVKARIEINFAKLHSMQKVILNFPKIISKIFLICFGKTGKNGEFLEDDMSFNSKFSTKNPIFGKNQKGVFTQAETEIMGSVELAPNFNLQVKNIHQSGYSILGKSNKTIGTLSMHPTDKSKFYRLRDDNDITDKLKPKFYTIKREGKITGKILGFFAYSITGKNEISFEKFTNVFKISMKKFKFDFSVVGLRNLDSKNPNPEISLKIPSYEFEVQILPGNTQENENSVQPKNPEKVRYYDPLEYKKSVSSSLLDYNPNICQCINIEDFILPSDPLYWPRGEITILNKSGTLGEEKLFHTVNLIECCDDLVSHSMLKNYLEDIGLLKRAKNKDIKSIHFTGRDEGNLGSNWKIEEQRSQLFRNSMRGKSWQFHTLKSAANFLGSQKFEKQSSYKKRAALGIVEENSEDDGEEEERSDEIIEGFSNPYYKKQFKKKQIQEKRLNKPGNSLLMSGFGLNHIGQQKAGEGAINLDKARIPNVFFEELEPLNLMGESHRSTTDSGFYNGFVLECRNIHKKIEMNKRKTQIIELRESIKELKKDANYDENLLGKFFLKVYFFSQLYSQDQGD